MLLILLSSFPLALACGPGGGLGGEGGAITAKPTMKFTYSPPLTGGRQSMNAQQAENRVNADIEFAVIKVVEGFSTAGVKIDSAVKADGPITVYDQGSMCPSPPTMMGQEEKEPVFFRVLRSHPSGYEMNAMRI